VSDPLIGLAVNLAFVAVPVGLGMVAGSLIARSHLASLARRERELAGILVVDLESLPQGEDPTVTGRLVSGQVVLSCDHFRAILGALANILGGEVTTFTRLQDRARREALVRLKTEARALGCDTVLGLRVETVSLGMGKGLATEILATGTAVRRRA
jgi:uncharacterized protein YbjQ (UPF0145 family)